MNEGTPWIQEPRNEAEMQIWGTDSRAKSRNEISVIGAANGGQTLLWEYCVLKKILNIPQRQFISWEWRKLIETEWITKLHSKVCLWRHECICKTRKSGTKGTSNIQNLDKLTNSVSIESWITYCHSFTHHNFYFSSVTILWESSESTQLPIKKVLYSFTLQY